jgi:hypothetical protein
MSDKLHTNTGYIDVLLSDMVLLPPLFAAVFSRFPLPSSSGWRNTDIETIHGR